MDMTTDVAYGLTALTVFGGCALIAFGIIMTRKKAA